MVDGGPSSRLPERAPDIEPLEGVSGCRGEERVPVLWAAEGSAPGALRSSATHSLHDQSEHQNAGARTLCVGACVAAPTETALHRWYDWHCLEAKARAA